MTKRMLIDATHAEETRVVVLEGNRLEDFDVETSTKRQLKGNIYLAKVVRVEPSLQAAFVEYGGGRHGFLAFGEIHPDYYQIPVADRQRLLEMQAEDAKREQEEDDRAASEDGAGGKPSFDHALPVSDAGATDLDAGQEPDETDLTATGRVEAAEGAEIGAVDESGPLAAQPSAIIVDVLRGPEAPVDQPETEDESAHEPDEIEQSDRVEPGRLTPPADAVILVEETDPAQSEGEELGEAPDNDHPAEARGGESVADASPPETIGGDHDGVEESRERRSPPRFTRNYKIQEVIKRRQILLVQVVKEERGTKGAALTTYLSLAGRYCVLMPNSPRGGGISRKITSLADRRRLKEATAELDLPRGMGLIVRTAGANRPKPEIKRDCEYLLRLWDDIREHTLRSVAPAQIYEEASLIKRSIRDVYSRDVDELIVDGEEGWRAARDFMRMLMPTHAKKVQLWREPHPLFARYQVDAQLDAMLTPTVQLRSGGYLVINQTEALVAVDVNSGRSTREPLPEVSAPGAEQPDLPPGYAGPTPANPFGGNAFDIFDVLEQAEAQAEAAATPALPRIVGPEIAPEPEPVEPAMIPTAIPGAAEPDAADATVDSETALAEAPEAAPEPPPAPANDEVLGEPAIKPILVGPEEAPGERKRGWWRR